MLKNMARSAIDWLPFSMRHTMLVEIARSLGVTGLEVSGHAGRISGAIGDHTIMYAYLQQKHLPKVARTFIEFFEAKGGGTLIDVGANVGLVAVPVGCLPAVQVIAIEADRDNAGFLRANAAQNKANVRVIEAAAYREETVLRFTKDPYNFGDHRLDANGSVEVEAITLDGLPDIPLPLALKIDTQGAEPHVFSGAQRLLAGVDLLVSEFWPAGMMRMGSNPAEVLDSLQRHFRQARLLDDPNWAPVADVCARLVQLSRTAGPTSSVDVVARK